jgi:hypothetical protein
MRFTFHASCALTRRLLIASLLALPLGQPAAAVTASADPRTDPRADRLVAQALDALGAGRDARAIATLTARVRQVSYHLADGDHADAPFAADFGEATLTVDLAGGRRISRTRQNLATQDQVELVTLAMPTLQRSQMVANGQAQPARVSCPEPDFDLAEPLGALRLAQASASLRLQPSSVLHGQRADVVGFWHRGFPVRLLLSPQSHLPLALEARIVIPSNIVWNARGDLVDRFEWMNWTLASGLRFPYQWDHYRNGALLRTTAVEALAVNQALAPGSAAGPTQQDLQALDEPGRRQVDDLPLGRPDRPITDIAPGVVQIPGSWYTTLVRQDDGIVVIDAPISNGYSRQVLAEAAHRFPGLPVKALVTTTAFGWHIAGVREYAARGIPIYSHNSNAAVLRERLTAPHTLAPDALARHPIRWRIKPVTTPLTLGMGATRLVLQPVRGATTPMLMAYLPQPRILHTAEMVQPLGPDGALLFPESLLELRQAVTQAGLDVQTMIGMHMSPTPWRALDLPLQTALKPADAASDPSAKE